MFSSFCQLFNQQRILKAGLCSHPSTTRGLSWRWFPGQTYTGSVASREHAVTSSRWEVERTTSLFLPRLLESCLDATVTVPVFRKTVIDLSSCTPAQQQLHHQEIGVNACGLLSLLCSHWSLVHWSKCLISLVELNFVLFGEEKGSGVVRGGLTSCLERWVYTWSSVLHLLNSLNVSTNFHKGRD